MAYTIAVAGPGDSEAVIAVQHTAFATECERYGVTDLPPMLETPDDVRALMAEGAVVLVAVEGGRILGSVRGLVRDGTCEVGRLVVLPEARRRGIARSLMVELEARFAAAERFELFTGSLSDGPLTLYASLGYTEHRREAVAPTVDLVYLEKRVRG